MSESIRFGEIKKGQRFRESSGARRIYTATADAQDAINNLLLTVVPVAYEQEGREVQGFLVYPSSKMMPVAST